MRALHALLLTLLLLSGCARHGSPPPRAAVRAAVAGPEVVVQGWPQTEIKTLAFDPSGTLLAAPLEDETLFFDVVTGVLVSRGKQGPFVPKGHVSIEGRAEVATRGDLSATAITSRSMKRYEIEEAGYGLVKVGSGYVSCMPAPLSAIALSGDGNLVACGESGGLVVVVDRTTGKEQRWQDDYYRPSSGIHDLVFHPTKPILAVASSTGLFVFDVTTGTAQRLGDTSIVSAVAYSDDGALLGAGTLGGDIEVWDTKNAQRVHALRSRTATIRTLAVDPRAPRLFVGSGHQLSEQREAIVDLRDGAMETRAIEKTTDAASFSPSADVLVTSQLDNLTATTTTAARTVLWKTRVYRAHFTFLAHAGDGAILLGYGAGNIASIPQDHAIHAFDARTGAELWSTPKEEGYPAAMAVSPDGRRVAVAIGRYATRVEVHDTRTGARVRTLGALADERHRTPLASLAFVGSDHLAVTGIVDGMAQVWDLAPETPKVVSQFGGLKGEPRVATRPGALAIADAEGVTFIDTAKARETQIVMLHAAEPRAIAFVGTTLAWLGVDGSARAITPAAVSTIVATRQGGVVLVGPEGDYLAPRDAAGTLAFRFGERAYPFEQFDAVYNNPAKALGAVGLVAPDAVAFLDTARARRLEQLGVDGQGATAAVPTVTLAAVPPVATAKRLALHVVGADPIRRLRRVHVLVNGVPILGSQGRAVTPSRQLETDVDVELTPGPNKIAVLVENEAGIASLEATTVTTYAGPAPAPQLHVVAIGVTQYRDRSLDLAFPAKDATDVATAFCATTSACRPTTLLDAQATRGAITGLRASLAETQPEDTVVVYVSGHGVLDRRGGYLFAPHDVDVRDLEGTGIPYATLEGLLDGIPARRKLLVMDTCNAGELDPEEARAIAAGGKVKVGASHTLEAPKLSPARARIARDLFAELRRGTGTHVLASSTGAEYSLEDPKNRNSIFTYALLRGLRDREAAPPDHSEIRVSDLRRYVGAKVLELTEGHQNPTTRRENLDADWDLTPNAPRENSSLADCRADRREPGVYFCNRLALNVYAAPPTMTVAAMQQSLEASAVKDGSTVKWRGGDHFSVWNRHDQQLTSGVAAFGPDEKGGRRFLVCRATFGLPEVLARCERIVGALAGKPLPQELPP